MSTASTISLSRSALADALLHAVQTLATAAQIEYIQANHLVRKNLKAGAPRHYGRPKLCLSAADLAAHMHAVGSRRRAHRRLTVLAPVLRMLTIGKQQRDAFELDGEATRRLVNFLGATEVRAAMGSPELEVVHEIVSSQHEFITNTCPLVGKLAALREPEKARLRRELLKKVQNARHLELSDEERAALREAMDLWVAR